MKRKLIIAILAVVMIVSLAFSVAACTTNKEPYTPPYVSYSKVGYSAEYLGTQPRKTPTVSDGGLPKYPEYGKVLYPAGQNDNEKNALIAEAGSLRAGANTYDAMDEQGNLYLNGEKTGKKLYKHTAAAGMYYGDVADNEQALIKKITIQARAFGNNLTGLYAPAGEVVKVEISAADLKTTGGIKVFIGQTLQNGQSNNIWTAREMNRMPLIDNIMTVNTETAYVGSFLGGPIYIQPINQNTQFTVTVSGAVAYSHFILGYTSPEEFQRNATSSAPYFDLEVWDGGVRHSGPKSQAEEFSYKQLTNAALLWEKIATVSNQVPSAGATQILTFLYDPFVAAGAAVAFVNRGTVNCPPSWMKGSLDYDSFVENGSWGNVHEFNHHHQNYGMESSGVNEVTNNATSLVSYSLFTKISASRTLTTNLGGWNRFTVPSTALAETINISKNGNPNTQLDTYANLLHSFGQDAFLKATKLQKGYGVDGWFKAVCDATHYDMTYYFKELLHLNVSKSVLDEYAAKKYPMYVPVASVLQTGVGYVYDGEKVYAQTVQPFEIDFKNDFEFDLSKLIVLPEGFSFAIQGVTQPVNGSLAGGADGVFTYKPNGGNTSGKMFVTLQITKNDGAFSVNDVELVLEFKHREKSTVLDRTVYTYSAETMYKTATAAYDNNFAGYSTVKEEGNINPTQNSNSDIWVPNPGSNAVMVVSGKVYIPSDGKYRFAIRGRRSVAMYLSLDNQTYNLAGKIETTEKNPAFRLDDPTTYTDLNLKAESWVYFKEVLLVNYNEAFIGMGWGKFNGDDVTISYLSNAYTVDSEIIPFETDYPYDRNYSVNYSERVERPTIVSSKYQPWDETMPIDLIFDENETNFIHSNKTAISEENPFEVTVDMGGALSVNRLTVVGEPTRKYQPKNFKLYGGKDTENMTLLGEYKDAPVSNNNVVVNFPLTTIRYYKIVVTDTYAPSLKYIAFRTLKMSMTLQGGKLYSPDDEIFKYSGSWSLDNKFSTFGHIYVGDKNAAMTFEFEGTGIAIFATRGNYGTFVVQVDGQKTKVDLSGNEESKKLVYGLVGLDKGKHTVKIVGTGSFNLDSIGIFDDEEK